MLDFDKTIIFNNEELNSIFDTLTASLEVLYVLEGLKPVALLYIREEKFQDVERFCNENGVYIAKSRFKYILEEDKGKGGFSNRGFLVPLNSEMRGNLKLYLSKSEKKAELARSYDEARDEVKLGRLLGYPECCVDFFVKSSVKKQNDYVLDALKNTKIKYPFQFYNNYVARYFDVTLLDYFPCSFNCEESLKKAKIYLECIKGYSNSVANKIEEILKSIVIYTEYEGICLLNDFNFLKDKISFGKEIVYTDRNSRLLIILSKCDVIEVIEKNHARFLSKGKLVEEIQNDDFGIFIFE